MSIENGAGVMRSKRTRVPLAVAVNCSAPLPPLTSTVSLPSPPSLRSVSSPGFQTIRSLPVWAKTWSSASPPVIVSLPLPPKRRSRPPRPSRVSLPVWPSSMSAPDPPVMTSLPLPPYTVAGGSAPLASLRATVSLPPLATVTRRVVLATVGDPPATAMAPLFTRIAPAALRLNAMVLSAPSPTTVSTPEANVATVAALARSPTPATAQAAITVPASSGRDTRRRSLLRRAFTWPPVGVIGRSRARLARPRARRDFASPAEASGGNYRRWRPVRAITRADVRETSRRCG